MRWCRSCAGWRHDARAVAGRTRTARAVRRAGSPLDATRNIVSVEFVEAMRVVQFVENAVWARKAIALNPL